MPDLPPVSCLVASDLSPRSDRALVRAFRVAERTGGRVVALHVVEEDYPRRISQTLMEEAESELHTQIAAMPESRGVAWKVLVQRGHDYERIADTAKQQSVDLLVLGGRREPRLSDLFLASTAQRVIRHAPVPVLVVKRPYAGPYGTALAAVDRSDHSHQAIGFALRVFPELLVSAFHAVPTGTPPRWMPAGSEPRTPRPALPPEYMAEIKATLDRLDGFAERGELLGLDGSPLEVLDELIRDRRPDLLVCGRSRSARSFFLGEDLPGHAVLATDRDMLIMP